MGCPLWKGYICLLWSSGTQYNVTHVIEDNIWNSVCFGDVWMGYFSFTKYYCQKIYLPLWEITHFFKNFSFCHYDLCVCSSSTYPSPNVSVLSLFSTGWEFYIATWFLPPLLRKYKLQTWRGISKVPYF